MEITQLRAERHIPEKWSDVSDADVDPVEDAVFSLRVVQRERQITDDDLRFVLEEVDVRPRELRLDGRRVIVTCRS